MDLILWRHAEAVELAEGQSDLERELTPRGRKQAARIADWLDARLPGRVRVLCSPARRTVQTAKEFGRKFRVCPELGPDGTESELLGLAGWPDAPRPVLIVGHQPTLGQTLAKLLGIEDGECPVRKGAVWWLHSRLRGGVLQTVVIAVQAPEML